MANLLCQAADFIHNEQANLHGTGDNIPATSALYIAMATVSGGPYTFQLGPTGGTQGNGTAGQAVQNIFCGLTPNTQYFYRTEERDFATGTIIIDSGPECSFTTINSTSDFFTTPGNTPFIDCDFLTTRNDISVGVDFNDLPLDATCTPGLLEIRIEYSTTNVGPWTLVPNVYTSFLNDTNPSTVGLGSNPRDLAFPFDANTTYFIRMTLMRNGVDYSEFIQSCTTPDYPGVTCTVVNQIDATSAQLGPALTLGPGQEINFFSATGDIPDNKDQMTVHLGTTPGGPYPTTIGPFDATDYGSFVATGLTTGQQYCYITDASEMFQTGGVFATGAECCFVQTNTPVTNAATGVGTNNANISGHATFVPATNKICMVWGTTPGGPYTNTCGCTPGTNTFQQPTSCVAGPVPPGTTVYYRTEVQTGGGALIEAGPEMQFTTTASPALTLSDPPDQTDPTPGDLGQLCTTFTASTLTDTRSFVFTPPTQGGCAPTVTLLTPACNPIAPKEPDIILSMTTNATLPQPTYSVPGPGPHRIRFTKAANDPICTYETTLTGGTGNQPFPGFDVGFYFISPLGGGPQFIGAPEAVAAGFPPNTVMLPGATGSFTKAGVTVTFTLVSGGQARAGSGAGGFLHRVATDGDTAPVKLRLEFDPPVSEIQAVTNQQTNSGGAGFTDNMIAVAPTATYQACCTANAPGTYCYDIQEHDTVGPIDSPVQNFCFTWTAPFTLTCGPFVPTSRNSFRAEIDYNINNAPFPGPGDPNQAAWYWLVDYSAGASGPWSDAPLLTSLSLVCGGQEPDNKVFIGTTQTIVHVGDTIPTFQQNTNYFIRWRLFDQNDVQQTEKVCGPHLTAAYPTYSCLQGDPGETTETAQIGTTSGSENIEAPCNQDTIIWEIATTPGGPYTSEPVEPVTGSSPSHTFTGLTPGTQYYYRARLFNPQGVLYRTTQDCPFVTDEPNIILDPCLAPTNVTGTTATLNGQSQNTPAGYFYRFRYGTVPGGPYPNVTPPIPSSGGSPDPYSQNVSGLIPLTQYYYTSEALNPALQVVATGGECTFFSLADLAQQGFYYCGTFYPAGTPVIFVTLKDGGIDNGYFRPISTLF